MSKKGQTSVEYALGIVIVIAIASAFSILTDAGGNGDPSPLSLLFKTTERSIVRFYP